MHKFFTLLFLFFFFSLCSQSTDGLIAHYPFDGDAVDLSGNGYNGTIQGSTFSSDRFGIENNAIFFDGFNDFIEVDDSQDLRLSGNYTISLWVNLANFDSSIVNTILSKRIGSGNQGYLFFVTGTDHPLSINPGTCVMVVSGGSDPLTVSNASTQELQWTHILYEFDVNTNIAKTYFSLDLVGEEPMIPTNQDITTNLKIGIDSPNQNSDFAFHGSMDDLRIYNRLLTDEEKEELLQEGTLNGTGLVTQNIDCFGEGTGEIQLEATGGVTPYNYSIDGGTTFQNSPNFTGLMAGSYSVLITDAMENTIELETLVIEQPEQITGLISNVDGDIVVEASGGVSPYSYSIDGVNFQLSESFVDLATGNYTVWIMDINGCVENIGSIDIISSLTEQYNHFSIFPNPVENFILIDISTDVQVERLKVISLNGKVLSTELYKSDEKINVAFLPQGVYFILLENEKGQIISRSKFVKIGINRA